MAWQLNAMASLNWRCWNDEWAVFDLSSGQTHQMDTLTAVTLMMLEAAPANLCGLASRVSEELLIPGDQELSNVLTDILKRLEAAGLIEFASQ